MKGFGWLGILLAGLGALLIWAGFSGQSLTKALQGVLAGTGEAPKDGPIPMQGPLGAMLDAAEDHALTGSTEAVDEVTGR